MKRSLTASRCKRPFNLIKAVVAGAAARLGAKGIDLYYVGPAGLAVALGHRWNGLPATQLHEFILAERRYVGTVVLERANDEEK